MSTEERSRRVMALFERIYDKDEAAREEILNEAAGSDPAIKEEVLALLKGQEGAEKLGFLNALDNNTISQSWSIIGQRINSFIIEDVMAAGGMGTVYKARHVHLDRPIALKIPHLLHPNREHLFARIKREGQALAKLDHPNIVKVYDAGVTEDEVPFIAMAFLTGDSLSSLAAKRVLSIDEVLKWGTQLSNALDYLHEHQIYHRDIKSSNILLDDTGDAILADFGIAYVEEMARMTVQLPGTPAYMCPEQIRGRAIDGRCDIYSLGLVLYELLAGKPPDGRSLKVHRPEIPDKLVKIIEKCIEHNPAHRYQTGSDLARALAFNQPKAPPEKRSALRHFSIIAFLIVLVISIGIYFFARPDAAPPPATPVPAPSLIESIISPQENLASLQRQLRAHTETGALSYGREDQFIDPSECYIFVFEDEALAPIAVLKPGDRNRDVYGTGTVIDDIEGFLQGKAAVWVLITK